MHSSKLGFQVWAIAIYLLTTSLKGLSSMKLHRELGITQKSAWHLAHRIRETWKDQHSGEFACPVEVGETYIGGKRKNMPKSKRAYLHGRGMVGKSTVVEETDRQTLQRFVADNATQGATVFTDETAAYNGTFHHISHEHLQRYVNEFSGRHNHRKLDTLKQMQTIASRMVGKRLKYSELTHHNA